MARPTRTRFQARLGVAGVDHYLGRWPSKKAAAIAHGRATLHFGKIPSGTHSNEAIALGPASPLDLVQEARRLHKTQTSSRYVGVHWHSNKERWGAEVSVQGRNLFIGTFDREDDAAYAHDRLALWVFGKRAKLNFPNGGTRPASLQALRREQARAKKVGTSSRYIGVYKDDLRHDRPWLASLRANGKNLAIGRYGTEREAAIAYDRAALWYRSSRVNLNFPKAALSPASAEMLASELLRVVKKDHTTRFIGVRWNGFSFTASITKGKKSRHLGSFDTEEEAAEVRDRAAIRMRRNRPTLNFDPTTGVELIGRVTRSKRA